MDADGRSFLRHAEGLQVLYFRQLNDYLHSFTSICGSISSWTIHPVGGFAETLSGNLFLVEDHAEAEIRAAK